MKTIVIIVGLASLMGCGGVTIDLGDGGTDGAADAQPDNNGSWPCGDTTCASGNVCVHPCCGGVAPVCDPANDAGVCPAGDIKGGACFQMQPGDDCAPPACQPPPPYCQPENTTQCPGNDPQNDSRDCYEACA